MPFRPALIRWIGEEWLLVLLIALLPVLLWQVPSGPTAVLALVDWKTIAALAGLMALSRGLEVSGVTDWAGRTALRGLRTERGLAVALVLFAAGLSAIVTNDVALFVTVPLTLALSRLVPLPLGRLVILQALAVNAGSSISPVGNPQNLFLWHVSGVGFGEFVQAMLPLGAAMLAVLLALVPLAVGSRKLTLAEAGAPLPLRRRLMAASLCAYPLFLLLVNAGLAVPAAGAVILLYAVAFPAVLRWLDWPLLLVFVLMFVDLGLLGQLPAIAAVMPAALNLPGGVFAVGAVLSQGMSNVPAAIFLAPFTEDWRSLAWGVSVGGFGLAIGSLANLIALRLVREPGLWRQFHLWSLPMFALSLAVGALLI
ncbi:SLC13 family permease [Frigidibacter mobilis]|uniref:NhaD family Na/H antiporter n=1 Tax=Frigidibacter mobilis TaxID=1335048 RepID=A0A161GLR0_9RHOB|nr:SLC13 family permease [Frigidibacter mobilis]AMY68373.1 NhaD family Na/H antiporter [Frigidibacter mobilis]